MSMRRSEPRTAGAPHWVRTALAIRNYRPPARYAELHRWWTAPPQLPTLYLHGADDGCMTADFTAWWVRSALPAGGRG